MKSTNDPRNIFVDNRQGYVQDNEQPNDNRARDGSDVGSDGAKQSTAQGSDGSGANNYNDRVAEMKRLAAKYQREGEGQLVKDIINNVIEQKAAGKLSNDQLVQFANRVMPLLNSEQKQRLGELLQQLLKL